MEQTPASVPLQCRPQKLQRPDYFHPHLSVSLRSYSVDYVCVLIDGLVQTNLVQYAMWFILCFLLFKASSICIKKNFKFFFNASSTYLPHIPYHAWDKQFSIVQCMHAKQAVFVMPLG